MRGPSMPSRRGFREDRLPRQRFKLVVGTAVFDDVMKMVREEKPTTSFAIGREPGDPLLDGAGRKWEGNEIAVTLLPRAARSTAPPAATAASPAGASVPPRPSDHVIAREERSTVATLHPWLQPMPLRSRTPCEGHGRAIPPEC